MNVKQIAHILNVSERAVQLWLKSASKKLPFIVGKYNGKKAVELSVDEVKQVLSAIDPTENRSKLVLDYIVKNGMPEILGKPLKVKKSFLNNLRQVRLAYRDGLLTKDQALKMLGLEQGEEL